VAASPNLKDGTLLATVDQEPTKAVVKPEVSAPSMLHRAITE